VDKLTNADRLPVVLAMTCLSSSFQQPARSGTTLDERLFVHPDGGAAAVWGPTGLGVSYGHESLQRGFYQTLWATSPTTPTLGMLTMAGYTELFTRGVCCQESLWTFVLFGDPLTQVHVSEAYSNYLPIVQR
jgi:hypothetical protein